MPNFPRYGARETPLGRAVALTVRKIWERVPSVPCRRVCADACTNVPLMPVEAYYLLERFPEVRIQPHYHGGLASPRRIYPTLGGPGEPCPFLAGNDCTIYDDRPLVCRAYGHRDLGPLDCGHGCSEDARRHMTIFELAQLYWELARLTSTERLPVVPADVHMWLRVIDEQLDSMTIQVLTMEPEEIDKLIQIEGV